uniref:Uncharacterized protein n=1 Tax=Meloidogyne enterolobii TaxID=390850 RepID=A0A6V7UJ66_MELEN|nr:unnamed protein product [Meloidogyne enterolobii]
MTEPVPSFSTSIRHHQYPSTWKETKMVPSRMSMDSAAKLKYRREAAEFVQGMAERLNHSIPQHRGHLPNFLDSLQQEDRIACLHLFGL